MSLPLPEDTVMAEPIRLVPARMGSVGRFTFVLVAVALAGVLLLARWLKPDERGYGTHEQLGLPPCAFRALTGIPCPSCGMTTSFAFVVRGRLLSAAWTNPGGCLLAVVAAGMIPWCVVSAAVGHTVGVRSPERAAMVFVLVLLGISLVAWLVRFLLFRGQG